MRDNPLLATYSCWFCSETRNLIDPKKLVQDVYQMLAAAMAHSGHSKSLRAILKEF
jgi:hypothetical protein